MFEEPDESAPKKPFDPQAKAIEQSNQFRIHAEIAAVFEATRKFDARLIPGLDPEIARTAQRTIGRLEKGLPSDSPVLPTELATDAATVLDLHRTHGLSTNDFHIHRRPGEVMILRWLEGEEVETHYDRLQAHFDAALTHFRVEERNANEWKQDEKYLKYLDLLDQMEVKLADRYLRGPIKEHGIFVLSTQTADEMDILYLTDQVMSIPAEELVGPASAPGDEPTEQDRAWFYKLYLLRGLRNGDVGEGVEQMCFFTFLQKSDDAGW